jgi:hypothetical protein
MAWRADHDGDGAALAKTLDEHPEEADHAYLMADLVTRGREELFAWLRWGPRATRARTLVGLAAELENRRIFAQAIGDHEAEAELAAIVARHREALLRRDIAVPLGVLEGLRDQLTWSKE